MLRISKCTCVDENISHNAATTQCFGCQGLFGFSKKPHRGDIMVAHWAIG